jgi:hypothetical protein
MAQEASDDRHRAYREALRRRVCAVCLDSRDDGSCGLDHGRTCALDRHGPRLIDAMLKVRSTRMDEYYAALDAEICSRCHEQDAQGVCRLRNEGACALAVYLPMIVDAIEEAGV